MFRKSKLSLPQRLLKEKRIYKSTVDFINDKYDLSKVNAVGGNIYGAGLTDAEFADLIITEFLGKDWYVVDPLSGSQVNETAFYEIISRYSPKMKDKGNR